MNLKLLSLAPIVLNVIRRASVLAGSARSTTTRAQYVAVFVCGVIVAAAGYFSPDIAPDNIAQALTIALAGVAAPLISRLLGYKDGTTEADTLPESNELVAVLSTPLVRVRQQGFNSWLEFSGTVRDARSEGFWEGVQPDGAIINLETCEKTGGTFPLPGSRPVVINPDWKPKA